MAFKIVSNSYDFTQQRISASVHKTDGLMFTAVSINAAYKLPADIKAEELDRHIKDVIREILKEASRADD